MSAPRDVCGVPWWKIRIRMVRGSEEVCRWIAEQEREPLGRMRAEATRSGCEQVRAEGMTAAQDREPRCLELWGQTHAACHQPELPPHLPGASFPRQNPEGVGLVSAKIPQGQESLRSQFTQSLSTPFLTLQRWWPEKRRLQSAFCTLKKEKKKNLFRELTSFELFLFCNALILGDDRGLRILLAWFWIPVFFSSRLGFLTPTTGIITMFTYLAALLWGLSRAVFWPLLFSTDIV